MKFISKIILGLVLLSGSIPAISQCMQDWDQYQQFDVEEHRRERAFTDAKFCGAAALFSYFATTYWSTQVKEEDLFFLISLNGTITKFFTTILAGSALNLFFYKNGQYGFNRGYSWIKSKLS